MQLLFVIGINHFKGRQFLPLVHPIHEYPRAGGISITGGHVYRGRLLGAGVEGRYVFGDLTNRLRSIRLTVGETGIVEADDLQDHTSEVGGLAGSLVSIDTDAYGELYLVFLSGSILRVTGHFNDARSVDCVVAPGDPGQERVANDLAAEWYCREQFVVDAWEVIGTDPDYPAG